MKFILIFYSIFFILTLSICKIADGTNEFMAATFSSDLCYLFTGSISWYFTNKYISNDPASKIFLKYFIGLLFLYLFLFILSGKNLLAYLIGAEEEEDNDRFISLIVLIAYSASFFVAYFFTRKPKVVSIAEN